MGYFAGCARFGIVAAIILSLAGLCSSAQADIWQWTASPTYGTGTDHATWYLPSTTLCAGGSGVTAGGTLSLGGRNLSQAYLVGADFARARLSYVNLTNAALVNAKFSGVLLYGTTLTGADFTGATVAGAIFGYDAGFTKEQLYSTGSYVSGDLHGISLGSVFIIDPGYNVSGWNFANMNLTDAYFAGATMTGASLANANLSNANFVSAKLTGADLRGAQGFSPYGSTLVNAILPDGKVNGLSLATINNTLTIRNHDSIPVSFQSSAAMGVGTLQFVFDGKAWHEPATFGPGVVPTLADGTLEIVWSPEAAFQLDEPMDLTLFHWGDVPAAARQFGDVRLIDAPADVYLDASRLYSDGIVTLVPEPASLSLLAVGALMLARRRRAQ